PSPDTSWARSYRDQVMPGCGTRMRWPCAWPDGSARSIECQSAGPVRQEPCDSLRPARSERSHRGLVRRFAKPLSGVTCFEGSNPSLSASRADAANRAPVAQWIERQVADLKVVGSSPAGRANLYLFRTDGRHTRLQGTLGG